MEDKPLRIFITSEEIQDGEADRIADLLDSGLWDIAHIRHPQATLRDMRNLIESIPQRLHRRLRIHGHFCLASEFNLGGLHLNRRCPALPAFYDGPHSRSCHSITEVLDSADCDYVMLSPIFDSISKQGYNAAFTDRDLMKLNDIECPRVIALGGVTPERLSRLSEYKFSGYAVKGAIDKFQCYNS